MEPLQMSLSVFACITPKPENFLAAKEAITGILERTRREEGCRMFSLHEDGSEGGRLFLFELWDNEAALESHYAQAYTKEVFAAYENWLACPVEIIRMKPIDMGLRD
jgi:quinol monooxygenase YgiN